MNDEYIVTEKAVLNADGIEVESERARWITARELMERRDAGTDWSRIEDLVDACNIALAPGGRIKAPISKAARAHFEEIEAAKPRIVAHLNAKGEIAEARASAHKRADAALAVHEAFARRFHAADSDL